MGWISKTSSVKRAERKEARRLVSAIAARVVEEAQTVVPVRTGFLRDSIHAEPTGELTAEVIAGADYAEAVEIGTTRQAAQPYLLPALLQVAHETGSKVERWF